MPEPLLTTDTEESLESPTLARRTFDSIKADIIGGQLAQGTKIVESDLALKYGISRGPLREAIQEDIYTARESLEGMAARLAARLMPDAEIAALSTLLDQHEASVGETEGKAYFQREGDIDFHFRIAVASRNQWILENLNGELYQLIRMCRHQSGQFPSRAQLALDQHRQIAAAIARRDEELAEILMRRHISGAWEIVKQILEEQNDSS
jgi:DNA-binding GntR family transcriptional regulator